MSFASNSVDNRTYFLLENSERSLQIVLMSAVNAVSVAVNSLFFYLVLVSKKEKKGYKAVLLIHNFSLFIAQFYCGSLLNAVLLFPFPAVYCIGIASSFFDSFHIILVWLFLFCSSVLMMYVIVLFRLHSMTRKGDYFYFNSLTYFVFTGSLGLCIFVPVLFLYVSTNVTSEEMRQFVSTYFPNCQNVFLFPGVLVFTDTMIFNRLVTTLLGLMAFGTCLYLGICFAIVYQIQMHCTEWSEKLLKHHRKVLKDTIVQNILRFVFLFVAPLIEIGATLSPPEEDIKTVTTIANALFVASPIPCTVAMLIQNEAYRRFLVLKTKKVCNKMSATNNVSFGRSSVVVPRNRVENPQVFFWLYAAQLHWGSSFNIVFLFPFPAIHGVGLLKNHVDSFYLSLIWILLFCVSTLMMFVVLLVRLRAMARPGSMFFFKDWVYLTLTTLLVFYVFAPILYSWISAKSSKLEMREYVTNRYPNCLKVLDLPGVFVYTSKSQLKKVVIVAVTLLVTGGSIYICLACVILRVMRQFAKAWSRKLMTHHRKVMKDTIVQNILRFFLLAMAPSLILHNALLSPETDTLVFTVVANAFFVAAPIPCTLVMFYQNSSYQSFLKSKLQFCTKKFQLHPEMATTTIAPTQIVKIST